ncbi:MAG TPA: alanine--glyoxylate aminotransferase family protein [bacterium]|nr:alanine--glyoxylate aminotransferase family protein [bacterium]
MRDLPEANVLIPGPTPLPPEVLEAMNRQMTNHRGPVFGEIMREVLDGLHEIFQTRNDILTFVASGTGGLEASVVNLFSPGDRVLSVTNGSFCERWAEMAERYGARVDRVAAPWGRRVPVAEVAARLAADTAGEYRAVLVTQSETSTGVHNDVRAIREAMGRHPALLMVDAISALGAIPLETDAWGVDVVVTASQKALMSPPGLAFLSVSERAWAAAERATTPRFYLDFVRARNAARLANPSTPFTTAVTVAYAVQAAVRLIRREGLDRVFARHHRMARLVRAGVRGMGLEPFVDDASAVDTVTTVRMPKGVDSQKVVAHARDRYQVLIGNGIGRLEHDIVRIGHLGYTKPEWLLGGLEALGKTLGDLGHPVRTQDGVRAANDALTAGFDDIVAGESAGRRSAGAAG